MTIGEGQTLCQRADAVAAYAGLEPGRLFIQYEGDEPVGKLQGQRHDGGVHLCPPDECHAGGMCEHGQHLRESRNLRAATQLMR